MPFASVSRPPSTTSVGRMIREGVRVRVWCDTCDAAFREVDLQLIAETMGTDFDLWGKATHCRLTEGCRGRNRFYHNARGYFCRMRH